MNLRKATASLNVGPNANYSVPAAMGQVRASNKPKVQTTAGNGDCRVVHREYIQDILLNLDPGEFNSLKFVMNPGNAITFPWLSSIALRYESYRFNALRFCYETSCGSSTSGTVMLIPDFDPDDPAPVSKKSAMSARGAMRAQPWLSFKTSFLKEDLNKRKTYYVRGDNEFQQELRSADTGNLFVGLFGLPAGTTAIGELWVEYDVQLMTPQTGQTDSDGEVSFGFPQTPTATNVFGTTNVEIVDINGQNVNGVHVQGNRMYFPQPGQYYFEFEGPATGPLAHITVGTNSDFQYGINGFSLVWDESTSGDTYLLTRFAVNAELPNAYFDFHGTGPIGGGALNIIGDVLESIISYESVFNWLGKILAMYVGLATTTRVRGSASAARIPR